MRGSASTRAQRTYGRGGDDWGNPDDLDPTFLRRFFEEWATVEDEIDALQERKKAMLAAVRSKFGRHQAEAVRLTMRIMMMDELKRAEHIHFNQTAGRYVEMIQAGEEYTQ